MSPSSAVPPPLAHGIEQEDRNFQAELLLIQAGATLARELVPSTFLLGRHLQDLRASKSITGLTLAFRYCYRPGKADVRRLWDVDAMMSGTAMNSILGYLIQSRDTVQAAIEDPGFCRAIHDIAEVTTTALRKGGKVLLAGNGGSAGDAQHIAGEMLSRFNYDRAPTAAIALTTDSSVLTAIGNDYGFERVFERQILGLGCPGDVLIAISTSGRSPNMLRAIDAGREKRLMIVGFTGRTGGDMASRCDLCLHAPSDSTPLIQQIHITAAHIICGLVEESLFPRPQDQDHRS